MDCFAGWPFWSFVVFLLLLPLFFLLPLLRAVWIFAKLSSAWRIHEVLTVLILARVCKRPVCVRTNIHTHTLWKKKKEDKWYKKSRSTHKIAFRWDIGPAISNRCVITTHGKKKKKLKWPNFSWGESILICTRHVDVFFPLTLSFQSLSFKFSTGSLPACST